MGSIPTSGTTMNFFTLAVFGYIFTASILIYIISRDQRLPERFFGKLKKISWIFIIVLSATSMFAFYARFIEPFFIITKQRDIHITTLSSPVKIALVADIQLNKYKNNHWVKKIIKKIEEAKPDLIIFVGDLISNEGSFHETGVTATNEAGLLASFFTLTEKYPGYYTLGNHEYGLGNTTRSFPDLWTGDYSDEVKNTMDDIGVQSLINRLDCPKIKNQKICFFGIDDIWGAENKQTIIDFSGLKEWDQKTPLIFVTHNPDGILYWPKEIKKPDLVLAGHTHGGQIYLPFLGPIGDAGVVLGKKYYRGLNYFENTPIYTSVGLGESGGPIRFMTPPELSIINLTLQ